MIIRERKTKQAISRKYLTLLFVVAFGGLAWLFISPYFSIPPRAKYFCDAETKVSVSDQTFFEHNGVRFLNGQTQSNFIALSGEFSSEVNVNSPYGMGLQLENVAPGEVYEFSVWKFSPEDQGNLIIDGNWGLYLQVDDVGEVLEGSKWREIRKKIQIPMTTKNPVIKVYAFNNQEFSAYFDDLLVRKIVRKSEVVFPEFEGDSLDVVELSIEDKEMNRLEAKREEAFRIGILKQGADDWVSAKLTTPDVTSKVKIRLKGDWTDHLKGKKWSFRVRMDALNAWKRMTTFSFQNPKNRSFLDEWVFHQLLEQEDVLTPRYDLINLKMNGQSFGVFAYEEHFEKHLVESRQRREGPILKFSEEGYWEQQDLNRNQGINLFKSVPMSQVSHIEPFKSKNIVESEVMKQQFSSANTLLQQFRTASKPPSEVFDLGKMAKYLAIVDVCKAFHGFIWHNLRFYYNPVISRLEPIGFDGYTENGVLDWVNKPMIGYQHNIQKLKAGMEDILYDRLFVDEEFMELYIHYLFFYSSEEFMQQFISSHKKELKTRESWIQKEFTDYSYDWNFLLTNARTIRGVLFPLPHASVRAFLEGNDRGEYQFGVENYHGLPVKIIGIGSPGRIDSLEKPLLLTAFGNVPPADRAEVSSKFPGPYVFYSVLGMDSVFQAEVKPWSAPAFLTSAQKLFQDVSFDSDLLKKVGKNELLFNPGKHILTEDVIIPQGFRVKMMPGTEIDLQNDTKIISKSPVFLIGTKEEPIYIHSSDQTGNGFTVLQAGAQSVLKQVQFDHLNTLNIQGWSLTGAVTFYESDVSISDCRFTNNHCEDALNIIRSKFDLNTCSFLNTFADAFDSDFNEGTINGIYFHTTGNDALDFSGSIVTVNECEIVNAGDKGISAGEESTIKVKNITIENANLGAVSKDLSVLEIENIDLKNINQGFAAYQKKPEFGAAKVRVKGFSMSEVKMPYMIEVGSELMLDDKRIQGDK